MSIVVGRYAPSPTGDLHLGNLRTALLAWLQARLVDGQFFLRIEDLDAPRVVAGSTDQIIADLKWLGVDWDGPITFQSQRLGHYLQAVDSLTQQGLTYACFCSRKDLREAASAPHGKSSVYPGTCAQWTQAQQNDRRAAKPPATRLRVADQVIEFTDALLGRQTQHLSRDVGDFVIKRADGLFAYQLAVVVDDIDQGVTDVVRGADLLDSTARQLYLANILKPGASPIKYWHVPLKNDESGQRMAKRDGSCSARQWQEQGQTAAQLITKFASELDLIDQAEELSAAELLRHLSISKLQNNLRQHG